MKIRLTTALAVICAAMVISCGGSGSKSAQATKIATTTQFEAIQADPTNDGKRFVVEGYLCSPEHMDVADGDFVDMEIKTEAGGEGETICELPIRYDKKKNSFYIISDNYADEDITFRDNEGISYAYDQKAAYTFTAIKKGENWVFSDIHIDLVK